MFNIFRPLPGRARINPINGSSLKVFNNVEQLLWNNQQQRSKSKVKELSNPRKRFLIRYQEARLSGEPFNLHRRQDKSCRFFEIINGFKVFNPLTNGLMNRRFPLRTHLYKGRVLHRLSLPHHEKGGRDSRGRLVVRHRGGGCKTRIRLVDFYRREPGPQEVVRLEHDPNRSSEIALIRHKYTNEYTYILRPKGLNVGDEVESFVDGIPDFDIFSDSNVTRQSLFKPGNCFKIKDIPAGSFVHCIALEKHGIAVLCRSAGVHAKVVAHRDDGKTIIFLSSKETRVVSSEAIATYGIVGNEKYNRISLGKAGTNRWKGVRPRVRAKSMNPCKHPLGRTRNHKKRMQPVSIYGSQRHGHKTVHKFKKYVVMTKRRYKMLNPDNKK